MEILWGLLALACPLAMLVLPVVALGRAAEAKREAAALATRLAVVEGRLRLAEEQLRGAGVRPAAAAAEPPPPPAAAAEPPPPPAAAAEPPPTPAAAAEPPPPPAADPAPPERSAAAAGWTPLSARDASPTATAPAPPPAFDLERWIGVRGAAVLGGIVLALAGLLLFKYSVEAGLISPAMRVLGGAGAGLACIAFAQTRWLRGYAVTANALAGAGCAALYAACWASASLYHLVPGPAAFVLMAGVTVACCALALRHGSQVIALLGLIGGFLTPLLVSTEVEQPLGRFGYILLLDVGLLVLARKRGWTALAGLSLVATVAYQALWVAEDMAPGELGLGALILGAFAAVFALAGRGATGGMRATQAAALLVPTGFSLWFSLIAPAGGDLWSHGMLLLLLNAAAAWLAREQDQPMLAAGIAAASLPPVAAWLVHAGAGPEAQGQAAAIALGIAALHHGVAELAARRGGGAAGAPVAAVVAALVALLGLGAMPADASIWLGQGAVLVAAALLLRQAHVGDVEALPTLAAVLLAGAQLLPLVGTRLAVGFPPFGAWLALALGTAAGLHALASFATRRPGLGAAVLHPLLVLAGLWFAPLDRLDGVPLVGGSLALAALATFATTRRESGLEIGLALLAVAGVGVGWTSERGATELATSGGVMLILAASTAFFTAWPHAAPRRLRGRSAWWASAGAAWAFFPPLHPLWHARWGDGALGLLPLLLGALPAGSWLLLRRTDLPEATRRSAGVWTAAAALGFVTAAIPLQLEHEWITVGWALQAAALLLLWRRVDHPGLKYLALALLAAVGARLLLNPSVLDYHPRGGMRILNWLTWTYLVPAAAMFAASKALSDREAERARPWESALYGGGAAVWGGAVGLLGLAVVFAWLNLEVVDWFARGDHLQLDVTRLQARDLSFSIVWAAYSVALLVLGVLRRGKLIRWVSLGGMLVTLVKVFLYDLGELDDLYRVASLVGLAVSLIGVSLLYQRFVTGVGA